MRFQAVTVPDPSLAGLADAARATRRVLQWWRSPVYAGSSWSQHAAGCGQRSMTLIADIAAVDESCYKPETSMTT